MAFVESVNKNIDDIRFDIKFDVNDNVITITKEEIDQRATRFAEAASRWAEVKQLKDAIIDAENNPTP